MKVEDKQDIRGMDWEVIYSPYYHDLIYFLKEVPINGSLYNYEERLRIFRGDEGMGFVFGFNQLSEEQKAWIEKLKPIIRERAKKQFDKLQEVKE